MGFGFYNIEMRYFDNFGGGWNKKFPMNFGNFFTLKIKFEV